MAFAAAHRGLSDQYAENTIPAFEAAVRHGFPSIEMDLRLTADGEVVLLHDAGIDRTTDGNGRVADMTYDELRTYDTGEGPVPRFDDLLDALADWPGHWNVEMKARQAAAPALDLLAHHGVLDRTQISSLDPRALRTALERRPEVPRGLIILGPPDVDDLEIAKDMQCSWVNPDHDFLDAATVRRLRDAGLRVGAWTVNDVDDARALVEQGVECIITDTVEVLEAVQGEAGF